MSFVRRLVVAVSSVAIGVLPKRYCIIAPSIFSS